MSAPSTKALFRATKPSKRPHPAQMLIGDFPEQRKPEEAREGNDWYPTPPEATAAFLAAEGDRLREIGGPIWEPAAGDGAMSRVMKAQGFDVLSSDMIDRGYPGTMLRSFYEFDTSPTDICITNPPYKEISARDGHGRWLKHVEALGVRYAAFLLNWDWMAARINGMDELHARFPMSRVYVMCWKLDFTGSGSPPQRNAWHVWDRDWHGETVIRRLFKEAGDPKQETLL